MKFDKSQFQYHGKYLTYGADRKFVARFKYGSKASFQAFLIKNFTVEEYFGLLNRVSIIRSNRTMTPLEILELKGYINDNCKKACKLYGYPQTLAGFKKMIADQVAERQAK